MARKHGYGWLQSGAEELGLEPLPAWKEVSPEAREQVLAVLQRLALSRVLEQGDGIGPIEREVGIGEDRALRTHLLLTCFEMLAVVADDGPRPDKARDSAVGDRFHTLLTGLLSDATLDWIATRCWVYRSDPLLAWQGLDEVDSGFSGTEDEPLQGLAEARARWDTLSADDRLREVAAVMRAVLFQYTAGVAPYAQTTRSVWGNVALLRELSKSAQADRINLLSETAFASMSENDLPSESFQGVTALIDDGEVFVCRNDLEAAQLTDWSRALAEWKPRGDGSGEALFAWEWGGALVVPEAGVCKRLESWLQEALVRLIASTESIEPAAVAETEVSEAA